jgi:hypothetical protein
MRFVKNCIVVALCVCEFPCSDWLIPSVGILFGCTIFLRKRQALLCAYLKYCKCSSNFTSFTHSKWTYKILFTLHHSKANCAILWM